LNINNNKVNSLDSILHKTVNGTTIKGVVLRIENGGGELLYQNGMGNFNINSRYFIASVTKLYTTAIIYQLIFKGKLNLDDKISKFLPSEIMQGLHIYKNYDYSSFLTIRNLLEHSSGLPDYFEQKNAEGYSVYERITTGNDMVWSFEDCIDLSKTIKPLFAPNTHRKAFYSDTNFQLLGRICEGIHDRNIKEIFENQIFKPLGLTNTYAYDDLNDRSPVPLNFKKNEIFIPKAMSSFGPDGGIVSNVEEQIRFLRAFNSGELFPQSYVQEMYDWRKIFYPLEYGVGVMRYKIPWIMSPFKKLPEWIGHSGLSGAFLWYSPAIDVYFSGTVNQIANPGTSFRMLLKCIYKLL